MSETKSYNGINMMGAGMILEEHKKQREKNLITQLFLTTTIRVSAL